MTTAAKICLPLRLELHQSADTLPASPRVQCLGDGAATVVLTTEHIDVHIAVGTGARADQRYIIDQVLRKASALIGFSRAELRGAHVAADTLLSVGLDLFNRTHGLVTLPDHSAIEKQVRKIGALEEGYRTWVNEDPSTRTSHAICDSVTKWAADHDDVHTEVLAEKALSELGLRLLLAVGQGSRVSPARLVMARYTPAGNQDAPLMILGKGITFDTGGINVKPYESFVSMMKNDMAGAALAFHLFRGLVEANHPAPLLLVIPTCENAVGEEAMRPGAVIKSYRGPTVRVDHTDAEGRLILADALAYATDRYKPHQVLCFATLTTAALIAYGPYATPVHFADTEFEQSLRTAAAATGEDLHFFEERIWHTEANRDREADLRNTARLPGDASRGAGSRNAAHFLRHFTDTPLCHFDIFASTWNWSGQAPGTGYGATGAPLRTLLQAMSLERPDTKL